jgi:hypothetical protein
LRPLSVGVGFGASLARVGVGLLAHLVDVGLGVGAQRLGAKVGVDQLLANPARGVVADRLGRIVGLGQDVRGLLADALELGAHELGVRVVSPLVEPVGELSKEPVDLLAVVAADGEREARVANLVDGALIHGAEPSARTRLPGQAPGSVATGFSPE